MLVYPLANAGQHRPDLIPMTAGVVAADALGGHVILVNLLPLRSVSTNESSPVFVNRIFRRLPGFVSLD